MNRKEVESDRFEEMQHVFCEIGVMIRFSAWLNDTVMGGYFSLQIC